jgi:hypothetical protein
MSYGTALLYVRLRDWFETNSPEVLNVICGILYTQYGIVSIKVCNGLLVAEQFVPMRTLGDIWLHLC